MVFLYVGCGDEGGAWDQFNNSQVITNGFFSGVFRIDVDSNPSRSHPIRRYIRDGGGVPSGWPPTTNGNYMVPNDNPWLDPGGSILEEFYAIGLRNPYPDGPAIRQADKCGIGDVGQDLEEEIDLLQKAGNYQSGLHGRAGRRAENETADAHRRRNAAGLLLRAHHPDAMCHRRVCLSRKSVCVDVCRVIFLRRFYFGEDLDAAIQQ